MVTLKRLALVVIGGLTALVAAVPATAQAAHTPSSSDNRAASGSAVAWDSRTGVALVQWECSAGYVCFWNDRNGTGTRCTWPVADENWTAGATYRCSWSGQQVAESVWNRGTDARFTGVAYYRQRFFSERMGCTRQGFRGNLAGTYTLRSHRWVEGTCG